MYLKQYYYEVSRCIFALEFRARERVIFTPILKSCPSHMQVLSAEMLAMLQGFGASAYLSLPFLPSVVPPFSLFVSRLVYKVFQARHSLLSS